jgi:hypothetical protein
MIVCLGWGSLIWDPRDLRTKGSWCSNGPDLALEFVRQSENGRLTLVLHHSSIISSALWIEMETNSVEDAAENLRKREGTNIRRIGTWDGGDDPENIPGLGRWVDSIKASAVVWTDLPPKFIGENGIAPSQDEAINHIASLDSKSRNLAESYVRRAPKQIRTPYREAFKATLGWAPIEGDLPHEE